MAVLAESFLGDQISDGEPTQFHFAPKLFTGEPSYPTSLGDLAPSPDRDHFTIVQILNQAYLARGERETTVLDQTAQELQDRVLRYRESVAAKYPPELRERIAERYTKADLTTAGQSMNERVQARLATGQQTDIVSDFDGTISLNPNHYLLSHIPGSIHAEPMLERLGREHFPRVFADVWRDYLKDPQGKSIYFQGGSLVPIREGVDGLFEHQKEQGGKMTVLSANFEPFVEGGLSQIPHADGTQLIAVNENCIISTDKGTVLSDLAQQDAGNAIVFIGDGSSDFPAMEASDIVACYFALEGSSFARELASRDLPHFSYRTFDDITLKLQELTTPSAQGVAA